VGMVMDWVRILAYISVPMVNCNSSGNRELEQAAAMLFPRVTVQRSRLHDTVTADFGRRVTAQRCMCTRMIVVLPKVHEFPFKVSSVPEEDMVKVFTANGSDESLNERMRAGRIESSPNNLQPRHHRLIQQINSLLEPFILHKCRISLFSCLDRGMA
jgi:hypothetical protein